MTGGNARNSAPLTRGAKSVLDGQIRTLKEYFLRGYTIVEPWVLDRLCPDLKRLELARMRPHKMTDSGAKMRFKYLYAIGNGVDVFGVGTGKNSDRRLARLKAIEDAKKNAIYLNYGCGSRKCDRDCAAHHSLRAKVRGQSASTVVDLIPAPCGCGIIAGSLARKMLKLAGVSDLWTKSTGGGNILNYARAIYRALSLAARSQNDWASEG